LKSGSGPLGSTDTSHSGARGQSLRSTDNGYRGMEGMAYYRPLDQTEIFGLVKRQKAQMSKYLVQGQGLRTTTTPFTDK